VPAAAAAAAAGIPAPARPDRASSAAVRDAAAVTSVGDPRLAAIVAWWEIHRAEVPWRATRDVYAIWVAEVMSVQTTLSRAVAAWEAWMARWPTVETLAAASLADVLGQWQGLGYPRRARDLQRGAQIVVAEGWPDPLTRLPGVGPYVAAAVRCFAREEPVLPCDVNVTRVLSRRFPDGVDISPDPWRSAQALMEFGQRICRPRPACGDCPAPAGCAGPRTDEQRPARRRQAPYPGSFRERRGTLLAGVLAAGRLPRAGADAEAALSLARDGLIRIEGLWLLAPN
jgi:A/G-specific adenine glycosylase